MVLHESELFSPTLKEERWVRWQVVSNCHHSRSLEDFHPYTKNMEILQELRTMWTAHSLSPHTSKVGENGAHSCIPCSNPTFCHTPFSKPTQTPPSRNKNSPNIQCRVQGKLSTGNSPQSKSLYYRSTKNSWADFSQRRFSPQLNSAQPRAATIKTKHERPLYLSSSKPVHKTTESSACRQLSTPQLARVKLHRVPTSLIKTSLQAQTNKHIHT